MLGVFILGWFAGLLTAVVALIIWILWEVATDELIELDSVEKLDNVALKGDRFTSIS